MKSNLVRSTAALLCLVTHAAWAGGIEQLNRFLEETRTFQADFTQTITQKSGRVRQSSQGKLMLYRPGKFRWQVEKPFPQLMLGDGQRIWVYDPDLKQAIQRKADQAIGSTPAALLAGGKTLEQAFSLKNITAEDDLEWLEATPKNTDSGFQTVRLGFSGADLKVLEMLDNFGQNARVTFTRIERNPKLSDELFRFTPPPGVDVLGL